MLIIQIALGIVLGVILLAILPAVLSFLWGIVVEVVSEKSPKTVPDSNSIAAEDTKVDLPEMASLLGSIFSCVYILFAMGVTWWFVYIAAMFIGSICFGVIQLENGDSLKEINFFDSILRLIIIGSIFYLVYSLLESGFAWWLAIPLGILAGGILIGLIFQKLFPRSDLPSIKSLSIGSTIMVLSFYLAYVFDKGIKLIDW